MKIALYKSIKYDYINPIDVTEELEHYENRSDYVRVSEIVDVDFPMLKNSDLAEKMLASLDDQEKQARLALANTLAAINQRRQEFLALSHDEVAA